MISKTAAARASVLPERIKSVDALPPNTKPSAVKSKLLPAPVSPVQAQYPCSSSTCTSSMSARFCTESARNTVLEELPLPPGNRQLVGSQRPAWVELLAFRGLQLQVSRMKRDRLLNVLVPVGPVVSAREFLIFMRDVQRLEMPMERPVLFEQEIVGAAIDDEAQGAGRGQRVRQ